MPINSRTSKPRNSATSPATMASTRRMALICGEVRMTIVGAGVLIESRSIAGARLIGPISPIGLIALVLAGAGLGAAAVDRIGGAGDPRGLVRGQIQDQRCDFVRSPGTA